MNKLMARIVAVVMAIAMLGTVSFAASYADGTVTPGVAPNDAEAQETVLVFATNTARDQVYSDGDKIIGLAQETDVPASIPVNAADLEGYDYITVAYGGSDGTVDYAYINIKGNVALTAVVAAKEVKLTDKETGEEVTYTNVAYAVFEIPADGALTEYGIKFNSYASEEDVDPKDANQEIKVSETLGEPTTISGNVTFAAVVLGVPYADFAEGTVVKATPYVVYAQ
ncbi:MAG: hypothetical protein J6D15_04680 [Clostridia bacterium]|nr:hypothetical protein [Clostridia bacterium]